MIKLSYFDVRGRVEPARLLLELAGAPHEFEAFTLETWMTPSGKERMLERTPFGQVPVLQDSAFSLCQSRAIYRYLARKLGLYGATPEEMARVDEVAETADEILLDVIKLFWNPQFAERRAEHREATGKKLDRLDRYFSRIGADAEHWVLPGRMTLADVEMAYALESMMPLHPGLLESFPRLHHAMTAFFAADGVRAYVRSDRRARIWTVPMAPFGGKPEETHQWTT
jgi:glutathione S-transferase